MACWSETIRLSVPKAGNTEAENEDAAEIGPDGVALAVADGATEGPYSRPWARVLVRRFVIAGELPSGDRPVDSRAQFARWIDACTANVEEDDPASLPSDSEPWYVQRGRERGGFATFAGVMIDRDRIWTGVFVGDTCMFHLRDGAPIEQIPAISEGQFSNSPLLLSSNGRGNDKAFEDAVFRTGELKDGDHLLIATDALAAWLAAKSIDHFKAWYEQIVEIEQSQFEELIARERASGQIKNDDCTLLIARQFSSGASGAAPLA
jgi:hypothetical protein